jgi:tetratricopeptide (TPR) repeat protein
MDHNLAFKPNDTVGDIGIREEICGNEEVEKRGTLWALVPASYNAEILNNVDRCGELAVMASKNVELYDEADKLKEQGDLEGAVAKLQELIALDPNYALAHAALARYYTRLRRFKEAIEHALKVCQLEPNDPFSYTALSVTFQQAGMIPEAEDAKARAHMLSGHRH